MKSQLIAIVAAVLVVGCGPSVDIHEAAEAGNIEAVKQHLDGGAHVNAKSESGWTPLHTAAARGHKEIVELLIVEGADVNAGDKIITPLHLAAFHGQPEIAELLIAKGADVNARDSIGGTPLHDAALRGRKEIAELLIANGADVNAKSDIGETPLDWANMGYKGEPPEDKAVKKETADLLRKHGGKTSEELIAK